MTYIINELSFVKVNAICEACNYNRDDPEQHPYVFTEREIITTYATYSVTMSHGRDCPAVTYAINDTVDMANKAGSRFQRFGDGEHHPWTPIPEPKVVRNFPL